MSGPARELSLVEIIDRLPVSADGSKRHRAAIEYDALRTLLADLAIDCDPNPTRRYDLLAEKFYAVTRMMAPGKSVAPEMAAGQPPDAERQNCWQVWLNARREDLYGRVMQALAARTEVQS